MIMKTWKLVSGIISIVLSLFVIFQSSIAGIYNSLSENNEVNGTAGMMVALLMIAGGIISIVVRKNGGKSGNIALIVIYLLAALIGFTNAGSYTDLNIWSGWCLICDALAIIAIITNHDSKNEN